jgi:alpha-D-xyloside xylohydrolase
VLEIGQRARRLYLPAGADWDEVRTGRRHTGGSWVEVEAPLETVPVFFRAGRRPW